MKILKSIVLSAFMMLAVSVSAQQKTIHLLHVNDMHAYLDRAAALGGIIDSLRALYPELLVLSAGDNRTGNPVNDEFKETNRPMMEVMNAFGVAASAIGNHEFDGKISGYKANAQVAKFPFICANIRVPESAGFKIDPYKIFDVDGVKVSVLSVVAINARGIPDCLADNVKSLSFTDPVEEILHYEDILDKESDVQILLPHMGIENDSVYAFQLKKYDAILGGHSHTYIPSNTRYNGIIVTQNINKMQYCSLVTITVENGEAVNVNSQIISVDATKLRNKEIEKMVEGFNDNPFLQEKVGEFSKPINNVFEMGSMVTDGQRYASGADITIQNYGGVRFETHDAGVFSRKDALMLDPFGNRMHVYRVSGAEVKKILEDAYYNDDKRQPFTSGMSYVMHIDKKTKEIKSLEIFNEKSKKIKPKKTYTFSCNNYVVSISKTIKDREPIRVDEKSVDCLMKYLGDKSPLDYTNITRNKIIED